ncbi:cell division protein FtsL [Candidatus Albibeggiatoa sp. nov. NOAA]|uniref:cell division protein FtsL n=1 Tax=Candidatus Albibeggiatoa sp. nov. NOAA TaxID=3162724 RepID=UPI0033010313|nr:cell division protein FtsL [Thiotrichaceae bacterium]
MFLKFTLFLLLILTFLSALSLIHTRHQNHLTFMQIQTLSQQRDELNEQWRQLRLEHSTLTQQPRIERLAADKLNMHVPQPHEMMIIQP